MEIIRTIRLPGGRHIRQIILSADDRNREKKKYGLPLTTESATVWSVYVRISSAPRRGRWYHYEWQCDAARSALTD